MAELFRQLGIDWKLFLSQLLNFLLLLIILRVFVYKPVLSILEIRRKKIEEGVAKAQEAETRLKEVDNISKDKLKEAESQCVSLLSKTQEKAKNLEQELVAKAQGKEKEVLKKADEMVQAQRVQALKSLEKESAGIIKSMLSAAVEMKPEEIDDKLVQKAVESVLKEKYES